jgi:hypothetical protein
MLGIFEVKGILGDMLLFYNGQGQFIQGLVGLSLLCFKKIVA